VGILLTGLMLVACGPDAIRIDVDFNRLSGLAEGDRVLFQDNPAGTVTSIAYRKDGTYQVGIEVDNGYEKALTEYSRFYTAADPTRSGSRVVIIELTRSGGRLLQDGASVKGMNSPDSAFSQWRREVEKGLGYLQELFDKFGRDVKGIPESDAYRQLKRSLEEWAREMERAGEQARDRIEREWLPRIRRELDELRKELEPDGREEELEPLEREVRRIRNI
jgi:hypothetical protein